MKSVMVRITVVLLLLWAAFPSAAQVTAIADPAHAGKLSIAASVVVENPFAAGNALEKPSFRPGESVLVEIRGTLLPGYHTYPIHVRTAVQDSVGLSTIKIGAGALKIAWPISETDPVAVVEEALGGKVLELAESFVWTVELLIPADTREGPVDQELVVKAQVCDNRGCTWGTHRLNVRLLVSGAVVTPSAELLKRTASLTPPEPKVVGDSVAEKPKPVNGGSNKQYSPQTVATRLPVLPSPEEVIVEGVYPEATIQDPAAFALFLEKPTPAAKGGKEGLWAFVLQGVFWGAVSLVTPCVFPMIPVTVSIFLKHKSESWATPIFHALVYCATIVVVMTLAALAFLSVFVWLSISVVFNIALGLVFIVFALSLFGMYDIELPSFMTQFTSAREQQGGYVGTFFMALTFSMLSFACVAPFLGGFGGTATSEGVGLVHKILGGVAFSATFASPFFILALFPKLLGAMPRSGGWMTSVKITMGFVELAAAVKFFRLAEIRNGEAAFFTYDVSLALTIVTFLAAGAYLLQFISLPSDDPDVRQVPVPRLILGMAAFAMALYLVPGLWHDSKGGRIRPQGIVFAWIDAFLLPDSDGNEELDFGGDLALALERSRSDGRPVFVDFTGVTCVNCKLNEKNVFPRPEVRRQLERYHLVQLHTDRVIDTFVPAGTSTEEKLRLAESNAVFRDTVFGLNQLPLYAVIRPATR